MDQKIVSAFSVLQFGCVTLVVLLLYAINIAVENIQHATHQYISIRTGDKTTTHQALQMQRGRLRTHFSFFQYFLNSMKLVLFGDIIIAM